MIDNVRVGQDAIADITIGNETHIKTIIFNGKEIYNRESSYVYIILDTSEEGSDLQ